MRVGRILFVALSSCLILSCAQEVLEPEQQISGLFALYDESWLVSDYVSFENGRLSQYSTMGWVLYPFAEGKIWHTDGGRFQFVGKQNYSIRDGVLTTSGGVSGPVELKDGVLTIGSKQYVALEGFEEAPYSRIVAQNEYVFTYTDQDISIPFTVENPLPYQELTAGLQSYASGGTWITNLAVQDGKITAHLSATAEDRTGIIELSYTHAESVTVQIKQQPSTFITIPETSRTVDYTSSTQTLNYTIENPVATSSLTATSSVSWINNIQISGNKISFDVQENNSGADRSATLTLRYEGARDVTFDVLQRWSSSSITLTPASKEVDYTGGTFTFNYSIVNPREGVSVTATSQSNWITNVQISGSTVSYKVSENNSGAQRTGKIKLTYGSYASAEFTVTQSWTASSITMTPSSQTTDYTGGSFSFSYAITNPRTNTTVTAESQVNWITNVTVSGNSINYKVAENNSGAQRTGKIKLSYGSYATVEFIVTQSWSASSITLTPTSQTTDYTSGSLNFNYAITNPRTNTTVTAESQVNWITDVAVSGNSISYKVLENNSAALRTGKIKLTYGTYATAEFSVTQSGKPVISLSLDRVTLDLALGVNETLLATVDPVDAPLQWSSDLPSVAAVSQEGKVSAVGVGLATITVAASNGKIATCEVTVRDMGEEDLGLSVKWASYNLGASSPEGFGYFYAWGETETKSDYSWSTYKFGTSVSGPFSRYNTKSSYGNVDNLTILLTGPEGDDVASKILGGNWRIPTQNEWKELQNDCTWEWVTINGIEGYKITGDKTGFKNKWIFLPAAGGKQGTDYVNTGAHGNYWSSSLNDRYPYDAWNVIFYQGTVSIKNFSRYYGRTIRPVHDK